MGSNVGQALVCFILVALTLTASAQDGGDCEGQTDLIFVVDRSGSICNNENVPGCGNWDLMKTFMGNMIERLNVGPGATRVAVMVFGNQAYKVIGLTDYNDGDALEQAILAIDYDPNKRTNVADAIRLMEDEFNANPRAGATKIGVVISDGISTVKATETVPAANAAKQNGVIMFAIGVTDEIDKNELRQISSAPQQENLNYFVSPTFEALADIGASVTSQICPGPTTPIVGPDCEGQTDLVFVVDRSGSICNNENVPGCSNWDLMKTFMGNMIETLNVGPGATRIAVVVFGNQAYKVIGLTEYNDGAALEQAILAIDYDPNKRTNVADAIRLMEDEFNANPRAGATKIGVVISDGISTVKATETVPAANAAKQNGVIMFAIGVTDEIDKNELRQISSPPQLENRNYFVSPTFEALADIGASVTSQICPGSTTAGPAPTTTLAPVTTTTPEPVDIACEVEADIVFIVDASTSIGDKWDLVLDFVVSLVRRLPVESGDVRIGMVVYSDNSMVEFYLDEYDRLQDLVDAIKDVDHIKGNTNTASGLETMREDVFRVQRGDRPNVRNFAVLLTDGQANIRAGDTQDEADNAKADGITIVTIGVTNDVDEAELISIASDKELFLFIDDFDALDTSVDTVIELLCTTIETGGVRVVCDAKADITFVLDGSASIGNDWGLFVQFVIDMVNSLPIGPDDVRVAVVMFSDDAEVEFYLNTYTSRLDLVSHIKDIDNPRGSTNIAAGLEVMREEVFVASRGDRADVRNFGILLTDGTANIRVGDIPTEANLCKTGGITMMAVGITSSVDVAQLNTIASASNLVILVDDFSDLQSSLDEVIKVACDTFTTDGCQTCGPGPTGPEGPTGPGGPSGPPGSRGPPGDRGSPGPSGPPGREGPTGRDGSPGSRGPTGPGGNQGPRGPPGSDGSDGRDGTKGAKGDRGTSGARGPTGPVGPRPPTVQGPTGPRGPAGTAGRPGSDGSDGSPGSKGDKGVKGDSGPAGRNGSPGSRGTSGSPGPTGQKGSPGEPGRSPPSVAGPTGPQGPTGSPGRDGARGTSGSQGPTGAKGAPGNTGPRGPQGSTGTAGRPGSDGSPGPTGPAGRDGATGDRGLPGPTGPQGTAGRAGSPGGQGPTGPAGARGTNGASGSPGQKGERGEAGAKGEAGNTGTSGGRGLPGPTGRAGSPGGNGSPGPTGAQGPTGPAGARGQTGPQGSDGERGPAGSDGNQGPTGPAGAAGQPGPTGSPGSAGRNGERGLTGPTGPAGSGGAAGRDGAKGDPGVAGPTGAAGSDGRQGSPGDRGLPGNTGPAGPTGADGSDGSPGARGANGSPGRDGSDGEKGEAGEPGEDGSRGLTGPTGAQGNTGPQGARGANGSPGPTGPAGGPGPQGADGDEGPAGPTGRTGERGIPGPVGNRGSDGAAGPTGAKGEAGETGRVGPSGPDGPAGPTGPAGEQGGPGTSGAAGRQGERGLPGPTGPAGARGADGARGSNGERGEAGPAGPTGSPGQDGDRGQTGQRGEQGEPGPTGAAGARGEAGGPGPTGPDGARGERGQQGSPGGAGPAGPTGQDGQKGERGEQGESGPTGADGSRGEAGSPGPTGPAGERGAQGQAGERGGPGQAGARGQTGPQGNPGPTGAKGDAGDRGGPGPDGERGQTGPAGPTGQRGSDGARGASGTDGDDGATGPTGPAGESGSPGPTGPQGERGQTGQRGLPGQAGPTGAGSQGERGEQGLPGPTGPAGRDGPQGERGERGQSGSPGSAGRDGGPGSTGPTGPAGPRGPTGVQGESGDTGPTGPAGQAGPTGRGTQGVRGLPGGTGGPGPTGAAGERGPQGPQGVAGPTGPEGPDGARGETGSRGQQGQAGPPGPTGNDGATGPTGRGSPGEAGGPGPTGPQGRDGARGQAGPAGPTGASGPSGGPGPAGPSGPRGQAGPPGPSGAIGPTGPQGARGLIGSGETGATGSSGPTGPEGRQGPPGPSGPRGETGERGGPGPSGGAGPRGEQGPTGREGPAGDRGPAGPPGPTGAGSPGERGVAGPTGPVGTRGLQGSPGPQGERGEGGPPGSQGEQGRAGPPGDRGVAGPTGSPGPRGGPGPAGPTGAGEKGERGDSGPPGSEGPPGPDGGRGLPGPTGRDGGPGGPGPTGRQGERGVAGPSGPAGPGGDRGATGPTGPVGRGEPGPQGPTGARGASGPPGGRGTTGPQGSAGPKGDKGAGGDRGAQGERGPEGPSGPQGRAGERGSAGERGGPGPSGPQGPRGERGPAGVQGRTGDRGLPGPTGGRGISGPRGPTGPAGRGERGPTGPRGAPGPTGDGGGDTVNECLEHNGGCGQLCIDTYNSYYCGCNHGYKITNGYRNCAQTECLDKADVIFIVDSSSSIEVKDSKNWERGLEFIVDLIEDFNIGRDNVRVGLITFNQTTQLRWDLLRYTDKDGLVAAVRGLGYHGGDTDIASAFQVAREQLLRTNRGNRNDVPDVVILISDGNPNFRIDDTETEATLLKDGLTGDGSVLITIGVTDQIDTKLLGKLATDSNYVAMAESYKALQAIETKVKNLACLNRPLARRGCDEIVDIVFVVDTSSSIQDGADNWALVLNFIEETAAAFNVGPDDAQFGMVLFSTDAVIEFYLTNYTDSASLKQAIRNVRFIGGSTNTASGLELMRTLFQADRGDRPNAKNIAILISDGQANVRVTDTIPQANLSKAEGITIVSVGVTNDVNEQELSNIASKAPELVLFVDDFSDLADSIDTLVQIACTSVVSVEQCDIVADITFVVDSSGSIKKAGAGNWQLVLNFISDVVNALDIGPSRVRVGMVLFGNHARTEFYLTEYNTKPTLLARIQTTDYLDQRTNLAAGLELMKDDVFEVDKGDRPNVPNIGIVISDGIPNERVNETFPMADQAKAEGITLFTIGVGDEADEAELTEIASEDRYFFKVASFDAFNQSIGLLVETACSSVDTEVSRSVCNTPSDIAFVVDSSGSIGDDNWLLMLDFMASIVNRLNIGATKAHVGTVVFSNNANVEFNLAEYTRRSDLLAAIRSIDYQDGATATAAGLQLMRENLFSGSPGDRANIPDVAIVLTDGQSNRNPEDTIPQAEAAHDAGITIIVIGITNGVDMAELQGIASRDDLVMVAENFTTLDAIINKVIDQVCVELPVVIEPNPDLLVCTATCCHGLMCFCKETNLPANGTECENINECLVHNGQCEHNCVDTDGSYRCECRSGFVLEDDGYKCGDYNECNDDDVCDGRNEVCINTYGGFYCLDDVRLVDSFESFTGAEVATGSGVVGGAVVAALTAFITVIIMLIVVFVAIKVMKQRRRKQKKHTKKDADEDDDDDDDVDDGDDISVAESVTTVTTVATHM